MVKSYTSSCLLEQLKLQYLHQGRMIHHQVMGRFWLRRLGVSSRQISVGGSQQCNLINGGLRACIRSDGVRMKVLFHIRF